MTGKHGPKGKGQAVEKQSLQNHTSVPAVAQQVKDPEVSLQQLRSLPRHGFHLWPCAVGQGSPVWPQLWPRSEVWLKFDACLGTSKCHGCGQKKKKKKSHQERLHSASKVCHLLPTHTHHTHRKGSSTPNPYKSTRGTMPLWII